MRLFALETNMEKLNRGFLSSGEEQILCIRFHGFLFFLRFMRALLATAMIVAVALIAGYARLPPLAILSIAVVVWLPLAGIPLLTGFIDWKYDTLILTTEKLIHVNQSSLFRREIRQMNLENLASVNAETQFGNIFPFGRLCFDLKEGTGQRLCLNYIPQADRVCTLISDCLVAYERRRASKQ